MNKRTTIFLCDLSYLEMLMYAVLWTAGSKGQARLRMRDVLVIAERWIWQASLRQRELSKSACFEAFKRLEEWGLVSVERSSLDPMVSLVPEANPLKVKGSIKSGPIRHFVNQIGACEIMATAKKRIVKKKVGRRPVAKTVTKKKVIKKKAGRGKAATGGRGPTGRPTGKTQGLGIHDTWAYIFQLNGKCPKKRRMTNEQIAAWMYKEFPGRKTAAFSAVQSQRTKYNKGGFTHGEVPKVQSVPYDEDGNPCEPRGGGGKATSSASGKGKTKKKVVRKKARQRG